MKVVFPAKKNVFQKSFIANVGLKTSRLHIFQQKFLCLKPKLKNIEILQ